MKKLLAIVISMAMIVAMMPMGVFAGEGESGTVEVTYPVNVENERDLRTALYNAPTNGTEVTIKLTGDITLEMLYAAPNLPDSTVIQDFETGDTFNRYKKGVHPTAEDPNHWNPLVTNQTAEQKSIYGAYYHMGATDERIARLVIKENQKIILDLNGHTIQKDNRATHGDWSNTCTDIIGNYGTLKVTDTSDSETKGTIKGIGYISCNGAVLHNYKGATMTVGAVNVDGNAAGMSAGTGQYVISNEGGTVTIDGTNVHDTTEKVDASLLHNTAGTMTIKGNATLNHPNKKTVNCKGGNVIIESATIISDKYAIYAKGGTTNITGNVTIKASAEAKTAGTLTVAGGTITKAENVKLPAPSGSIWTKVGDTEVLVNEASVAVVGGVGYENISDAINAASDNVTVTLLKDVNTSAYTEIRKPMTIDFGGNKFTSTGGGFDVYANLTLKNGTLNSVNWGVWVQSGAELLVDSDMVINTTSTAGNQGGITVQNNGSKVTVKGTVTAAGGAVISGIGNPNDGGVTINIEESAVITNTNSDGLGIYYPNTSNLNIKGGIITGATGVYIKSGQTNITGGIINGNGTKKDYEYYGNGGIPTGDALVVDKCGYPGGDPTITVNGGTFSSTNANAVASYVGNSATDPITKFISGGTFSTTPKQYTADSYMVCKYSDAKYEVFASNAEKPAGYIWTAADTDEQKAEYDFVGTRIYVPSTPATPADNVTNNAADKSTTADLTPAVKDNKAETTVDAKTADKIVDKAVENNSTEVVIDAAGNNSVASSEVGIPEKTVKELAEKTDANLVIKTDNGKVDLDRTALEAVAEQAGTDGTVKLAVETVKTDENICHVELKLITSNGAVKDFRGGNVKVTINLTKELAAKDVVCVYINDNGIYTLVEGVLNADGTYTFTTGHFSEYAVMAKGEADKKIAEQLDTMIKDVNLKVRTSKTAKKNIKAVVSGDITALTDAGYTVKYKFYRSTKKASKYVSKGEKTADTYINTAGKKGTKYYYKAKAMVYSGDTLVGQTVLKQCKYGVRTWSK